MMIILKVFKTKGNLIIGKNLNGDLEVKQDKD